MVRLHNRRDGAGKTMMITQLGQPRRSGHLFMDALDGVAVAVSSEENDRHVANLTEPSASLDTFAASFEIDVHQHNVRQIAHCPQP